MLHLHGRTQPAGVPRNVIGKNNRPHARLTRPTLAHQQHLTLRHSFVGSGGTSLHTNTLKIELNKKLTDKSDTLVKKNRSGSSSPFNNKKSFHLIYYIELVLYTKINDKCKNTQNEQQQEGGIIHFSNL